MAILVEMTGVLEEGPSLRPDLIIKDRDIRPVIIETSFGPRDADKDARVRLGCTLIDGGYQVLSVFSVHLDSLFRSLNNSNEVANVLRDGQPLRYALHQLIESDLGKEPRRFPRQGFITGSIFDLLDLVCTEALPQERVEVIASYVAMKVQQAADRVRDRVDHSVLDGLTAMVHQQTQLNALNTTMVLWLNAILVHRQLVRIGHPVAQGFHLTGGTELRPTEVKEAWNSILQKNWYSVFQPAVSVLSTFIDIDFQSTAEALLLLIDAAGEIEKSRAGVHMNMGAELFPKLADDRKESAAFYTQPSTAELLARLTIREDDVTDNEWGDPHFFAKRSIADLACGTGTLLRAGYRTVWSFHERHRTQDPDQESLHRDAMEHGLIGADISPIAAHLTTSSLALMDLGQTYSTTRVGWLHVGGANASTGSLEYLQQDRAADFFDKLGGLSTGSTESERDQTLEVHDASVDWMLMNPPYSRTRGGQRAFDVAGLTEERRLACQKRWQQLTKSAPVNNKAGMAASFLAIAKKKVKPGGRIGFVLPLTAAFAPSWIPTREMLLQEFHDLIVVAIVGGKALGKTALSADTGMEEMLLIATRNKRVFYEIPAITFVTIHEAISNVGQACETARSILSSYNAIDNKEQWYPITVGDDQVGQIVIDTVSSHAAPWSTLSVSSPYLARAAKRLIQGTVAWKNQIFPLPIAMTTLSQLFKVGPTHHLIGHLSGNDPIGAFEMFPLQEEDPLINPDLSLWHADANTQKQILVSPTHKGVNVLAEDRRAHEQAMRKTISTLLYARNMSWTSQALLAATTKYPVLGGRAWTTLQSQREEIYWAFLLWANSTLGLISHWTQGQRTHPGRSTTQISALKAIPCPDFNELDSKTLQIAKSNVQKLIHEPLLPACQAHCDRTRKKIDLAVAQILNLPEPVIVAIEEMRELWCREGSVHGQNKRALELLANAD